MSFVLAHHIDDVVFADRFEIGKKLVLTLERDFRKMLHQFKENVLNHVFFGKRRGGQAKSPRIEPDVRKEGAIEKIKSSAIVRISLAPPHNVEDGGLGH